MLVNIRDTTPTKPTGTPSHHPQGKDNRFSNPWPSAQGGLDPGSFTTLYRIWQVQREMERISAATQKPLVRIPDWGKRPEEEPSAYARDLKATWLGHACFLVEFPSSGEQRGLRVLFDPVFSHRCSPFKHLGPARFTPPPIPIHELPDVDLVVISHNHYDHTDMHTIIELYKKQAKGTLVFFVPLKCGPWFDSLGISREHLQELDWWDEREVTVGNDRLRIVATPCQHFSGRSGLDARQTLWTSWAVQHKPLDGSQGSSVWFGGDTGYARIPPGTSREDIAKLEPCPAFKETGDRLGPFDLGLIPIGAYSKDNRFSAMHANPEQAVEIHKDVKAKRSLGIHWGTFQLSSEPVMEPAERFIAAGKAAALADGTVDVCDIGETVRIAVDG